MENGSNLFNGRDLHSMTEVTKTLVLINMISLGHSLGQYIHVFIKSKGRLQYINNLHLGQLLRTVRATVMLLDTYLNLGMAS